ncbi:EAL and GGDEF domain-containing protein [Bacillus pinisoli]|uniref:sensor domain-containing protein n=1 Tax=Bacillus pinisoli TaxID=2901866 RepID=UPI001FF2A870|nr:EAL domain-containing protein [Bacillus pinisoli]
MNRINQQLQSELELDIKDKNYSNKMTLIINEIILNVVSDLVYLMKVDHGNTFRYVYANEAAYKRANINEHSMGLTIQEVIPGEFANYLQEQYEKAVTLNEPIVFQDNLVMNGKEIYSESILTPINDDAGQCRYVVSVTRDITDKMQEKFRMLESQQRYKSLMDHNMDAVISVNESRTILNANPSTYGITGYTEKELTHLLFLSLVASEHGKKVDQLFQDTLQGKTKDNITCQIVHKSGMLIDVQLKMIPIVVNVEIKGVYIIMRDITEQLRSNEVLKFITYHDHLTGLPNRSSLKEDIHQVVSKSKEHDQIFGLMYLDLDRFKFLNDSMGHYVGDLLLKEVAQRLTSLKEINQNIAVYRQGGDEFILIIEDTNRCQTQDVADQVLSLFQTPFLLTSQEFYVTPSVGISMYPKDGLDEETLIKSADTALSNVKDRGRGHYQFYSQDMQKGDSQTMLLETCLRRAIEKDELLLYYQPQVDLYTGEVYSYEALLRWNCGLLGFVSPADFIPLAEETGLIIPIGEWVIEEACLQLNKWRSKGHTNISVAINLSGRQFQQPNLVEFIKNAITSNNIDPSQIEIEITEGAMQDTRETIGILNKLKEIGVQISVDDFGTGYSSLSYLKRFPLNTLKIDQSFVRDVLSDEKDAAITTTIIHLAHSLGFNVVAEGVELEEQAEFLRRMDCEKAQGYLFSKPVPASQIEKEFLK